jgi:hypothetical protein
MSRRASSAASCIDRGEVSYDFVGRAKLWYLVSGS